MRDHPAPALLHRWLNGDLPNSEARKVVRHLVAGCARCRAEIEPEVSRLLSPDLPPLEAYERPIDRAVEDVARYGAEIAALKVAARKLHDLFTVHGLEAPLEKFSHAVMVEALLRWMRDLRHEDPERMLLCGQIAIWVARRMPEISAVLAADLRTRACIECANALRVNDRLDEADETLDMASVWVKSGSGSPEIVLRLNDIRASLLASQERYAEAARLAETVLQGRLRLGDLAGAVRALIQKAIFTGYGGRPEEELLLLEECESLAEASQEPELRGLLLHNKIHTLLELSRPQEAWELLEEHRAFLRRTTGRMHRIRLRGVEGRILASVGQLALAERALREARDGFAEAGLGSHQALMTLDLATVVLRQGRNRHGDAVLLAIEALRTFAELNLRPHAEEALVVLADAVKEGLVTAALLESVASFLRRAEHDGQARYQPRFE